MQGTYMQTIIWLIKDYIVCKRRKKENREKKKKKGNQLTKLVTVVVAEANCMVNGETTTLKSEKTTTISWVKT